MFRQISRLMFATVYSVAVALVAPAFAQNQDDFAFWPGATYDASIPTLQSIAGHENGERITKPEDVVAYFQALEAVAPDRIKVWEYARTWQGRPLIYAAISSPENIARLDDVRTGVAALADPRATNRAEADRLISSLPGSTWIAYGVHGNEISSTDAAIMTAYHLLAAQNDERVQKIMNETIVFIDPMQNPDGRARFIHNFETSEGLEPQASRLAAERNEPWPNGRTNHYLFDMNRDWFALTQPETVGRIRILREWMPLVFVDAHEMGSDSTYYFAPEAVPYNPHLAADQRASLELFGRNNARWFDRFGFDYFTREVFDAFYPGYGASWPSYYGAIAMTYEQASARGLKARRNTGEEFHYRDTVRQHFVTSLSTAEVTADNSEKFLREFYSYRVSAIEEGRTENVRSFIFPATRDAAGARKIASLLTTQGAEVIQANAAFQACGASYDAGAYIINLNQPSKRLLRTLLDENIEIEQGFLEEQERLRSKNLPDQIYDVTAWSLAQMFNVEMDACGSLVIAGDFSPFDPTASEGGLTNPDASVAFLVNWGERPAARLLALALRRGLTVYSSDLPFTLAEGEMQFNAGALIFKREDNPDNLPAILEEIVGETGAEVIGVSDSWATSGPNFGSFNVVKMPAPRVAIAWDMPTNPYSAGNTRYVIERQFDYPVTAIRMSQLGSRYLDNFDVLVLPAAWGDYTQEVGAAGAERIKDWVDRGGVLIGAAGALRFMANPEVGLLSSRRENAAKENGVAAPGDDATVEGKIIEDEQGFLNAVEPKTESPDPSAGVMVKAVVDSDHWLAAGVAPELNVLVRGGDIYTPVDLNTGTNVARFAGANELVVGGHLWEQTRDQLAYKPFVIAEPRGAGQVIAFTQDPTVRAYLDGLNLIYMNAIFRGAAHATPPR
ncbi:M14 family zinc carboxypeptidase [Hyphococcus flavus]|uniref:M14 family zinc carboxypeptidase n=1 Tax=Hyphococcus flavus TaxID=1866326 RepID=A0AAE9ZL79_9PROT|nr:M14 family zinc carboxypeptidase [Hyphococcus flavus]WDI32685.1 M14 family zinc carboxypeptidase [Hyphococcus flavus]